MNWPRRTRTRSCARRARCCCCSGACASHCCAPRSRAYGLVADAIKFFEKDIRSAGIPEQQANIAKYILCATADDIVQNIPTEDRHVWTQYSMLSRFFGERIGGVRFFEELGGAEGPADQLSAARAAAPVWRSASRHRLAERPATAADPAQSL
jgi:type VI protein secretion system component VasF